MILCLKCATVHEDILSECSACGEPINLKTYERILRKMDQYIRFGYSYRRSYEDQFAKDGKIEAKFHFGALGEPLAWLGLAVLSGVIGGASWDFVKQICRKIASQLKENRLSEIAFDDGQLKLFADYMLDYHNNFKNVGEEVRDALLEEMQAHAVEEKDLPSEIDFNDKVLLSKILKKNIKKAKKAHSQSKISISIVKGLWGKTKINIECESNIDTEPPCVGGGEGHAAPNT